MYQTDTLEPGNSPLRSGYKKRNSGTRGQQELDGVAMEEGCGCNRKKLRFWPEMDRYEEELLGFGQEE